MNKKAVMPLLKQKKPKDDSRHLEFSITKNVIHHDDYGSLVKKRGYKHRKTHHQKELEDDVRRQGFWQTLEEEIEKVEKKVAADQKGLAALGLVRVKKTKHRRSPYVVKVNGLKTEGKVLSIPTSMEQGKTNVWEREVERLRKEGERFYKDRTQRVKVDFLNGRQESHGKKSNWSLARFPIEVVIWIFEFILSIPLGFLLLVQLLLKIIEKTSNLTAQLGLFVGRTTLFIVRETFLGLITLFKAVFVIPLKLAGLGCLIVYRLASAAGRQIGLAFKELWWLIKKFLSALAMAPLYFLKRALVVMILALGLIAPLKFIAQSSSDIRLLRGRVLGSAREAVTALGASAEYFKEGQASALSSPLNQAGLKFSEAQDSLDNINLILRGILKLTPQGQDAQALLTTGEELTKAGTYIAAAIAPFVSKTERESDVISAISNLSSSLMLALPHLRQAREKLQGVDSRIIPETYRARFETMRQLLPKVEQSTVEFIALAGKLSAILGGAGERRYAVLFQNNNELRPAGGFIGSLALVTIYNGRVEKIDVPGGGSYDFQGYLTKQVLSPKPLALINPRWELQDANWYPDWPTSAEKVAWFLENSGESSPDGVIAIQASILTKLLSVLGPIDFPEYQEKLTAENVISEIQQAVEVEYDKKANHPKKYIAELVPRVLDRILASTSGQFLDLFDLVRQGIEEKDILVYFRDQDLNKEFISRGWEPKIIDSEGDYLSVIHANIGGGKTDGVIEESWKQTVMIDKNGEAEVKLVIRRRHSGDPNNQFEKSNNVDFVRVYTPLGSELLSSEGFKPPKPELFEKAESYYETDEELVKTEGKVLIDEGSGTRINNEFGKTVFGNWLQVNPGNTRTAIIRYRLPFKIKPFNAYNAEERGSYSILIQKQPGARPIDYEVAVEYPEEWGIIWKKITGEATLQTGVPGLAVFTGILNKDSGFGLLFTENK